MEKEIQIELSAESEVGSGYYYASLELPASREQIRDAQQKARWTDSTTQLRTIGVTSCAVIPNLVFARLDTTSIDEMNFLAHLLESMDASERLIYHGLYQHLCKDEEFADPLSVKDLINMTYGLDSVMVASNVTNLKELGQFVIDNELNENVNAIPEDSVYLIDLEKLGRLQQSVDSGIFIGNLYIVAGDFEMPQVYDGVNLPEMPEVQGLPEIIEKLAEYSLLSHDCACALESVGLDAYVGFLHTDRPGRASLALDLMEELRPCMADRFVLTLMNNRKIKPEDFQVQDSGAVLLTDDGRRTFLKAWQEKKRETLTHPFLGEKLAWGMIPYIQALLLARYLRGDLDAYPPFLWK